MLLLQSDHPDRMANFGKIGCSRTLGKTTECGLRENCADADILVVTEVDMVRGELYPSRDPVMKPDLE